MVKSLKKQNLSKNQEFAEKNNFDETKAVNVRPQTWRFYPKTCGS
jgi:hypothetical protein